MATIARGSKASGGTAFLDGTTAYGSEVETDFSTIYTAWNNTDAGTNKWTVVSALNTASTVIIADNSTGSNNVFEGRVNGVAKVTIGATGILTTAATIAMSSQKITGLANGTAATDAVAFSQLKIIQVVAGTSTTNFSTTSGTFQTTNLSASITPSSASNKVLIIACSSAEDDGAAGVQMLITLARGGSNILGTNGQAVITSKGSPTAVPFSLLFLDSPATTSSTTYAVQIKNSDSASTVVMPGGTTISQVMILMEVAP